MKSFKYITTILLGLVLMIGCDLVDPSDVENPSITEDKLFEDAKGGAKPLVNGLQYAFADALNRTTVFTECVSDNYVNTSTFLSTLFDDPRAIYPGEQYMGDRREIYGKLQILLALSNFGMETILPADNLSSNAQEAQVHYYKGMAILLLSENFVAFPLIEGGAMVNSEEAILSAIDELKLSIELDPSAENVINCKYALARAYRLAGDKDNSVNAANEALGMDNSYVLLTQTDYDQLPNRMNTFTVIRTSDDMQPLPRLDFLDPKYPEQDSPIPTLKAEEAYLILAEAAIVDGDLDKAQAEMKNAISLAKRRTTSTLTDNDARKDRPSSESIKIKAGSNTDAIAGLVKARGGSEVTVHTISYTHLDEDYIDNLSYNAEDHYYALYLLRQEIFFGEGRRMSDLGIRLPVMLRQIETNNKINHGDLGTEVYVPSYIPQGYELDAFTIEGDIVTIQHDMNQKLVENITEVSPFK